MSLILEISDAMEEDIHLEVHLIRCYSLVRYYQSDPRESMMVEKISMTVMESQKHGAITFKRKEKRSLPDQELTALGHHFGCFAWS